jgi:hypothetical protein
MAEPEVNLKFLAQVAVGQAYHQLSTLSQLRKDDYEKSEHAASSIFLLLTLLVL